MATKNSSFSELRDDLLAEVLIRFPGPKSTVRSNSVCKRWNSLISDPYFRRGFVSHHHRIGSTGDPGPPFLAPSKLRESILSFLPMPSFPHHRICFSVLDCYQDLLLIGFRTDDDEQLNRTFLVCNLFTKQWVALPLPDVQTWSTRSGEPCARLLCEPCNSSTPDSEHRFRVVRMRRDIDPQSTTDLLLDVFCSESGEWTEVALDLSDGFGPYRNVQSSAVSLDGKLYWKNGLSQIVQWDFFCLDNQTCSILTDFPEVIKGSTFLSVSQGALHMILLPVRPSIEVSVWRFKGGIWRKLYGLSYEKLFNIVRDRYDIAMGNMKFQIFNIVGNHPEKPEIIYLRCAYNSYSELSIFSCNLRTEEVELLFSENEQRGDSRIFHL